MTTPGPRRGAEAATRGSRSSTAPGSPDAAGTVLGRRHVRTWLRAVVAAIVVSTAGYMLLLGWSFWDALYMTVISLTTVGFREVHELDMVGRIWTMLATIAGVAIIFGGVGIMAEALFSDATSGERERRRVREAIDALTDHYVVCGYGRVGSTVARQLRDGSESPVIIDVNPPSLVAAREDGFLVVEGDATKDATLRAAGLNRARGLVTAMDSDVDNVYVTLSARNLNPDLFIVARASLEETESKLAQAGANRVVSPYTRAGRHIAELALRPGVADYIDAALSHGELAFSMEEIVVGEGGPLAGRTADELQHEGIHVLAVVTGDREYEPNPPGDRRFVPGEALIVSGAAEPLRSLRERS